MAACIALGLGPPLPESAVRGRLLVAHNANAADSSNIDAVRQGGLGGHELTGAGVWVGIWDSGAVLESHQDLTARVRVVDGSAPDDHATHTAGTILGDGAGNAAARGMAPEASALSYSWTDAMAELAASGGRLSVSNHAYGPALGWFDNAACDDRPSWASGSDYADEWLGRYGPDAAEVDRVVRAGDDIVVWSAGNTRRDSPTAGAPHYHYPSCADVHDDDHAPQDGRGTVGGFATAKNVIAVGAVDDLLDDPIDRADIEPLYFSASGPTDDGRVKPELVANGFSAYSTAAGANDAYGSLSGTSVAAAVVTGGIALLVERYRLDNEGLDPRAEEIRALLVHTAIDAAAPGPDLATGYGLFDGLAAANLLASAAADASGRQLRVGVLTGEAHSYTTERDVPAGTELKATLAWLDAAGEPMAADDPSPVLVNDLDLLLIAPDGATLFHPWSLDAADPATQAVRAPNRVDPTEVAVVSASENVWSGRWTLRIAGVLRDGGAQSYALISSEPIDAAPTPVLAVPRYLELAAPIAATAAASKPLIVPLRNLGSAPLRFEVESSDTWLSLRPMSGETPADVVATVNPTSLTPGEHQAVITVFSDDASGPRRVSVLVHVVACTPRCEDRNCGLDPLCGVSCGLCAAGELCDDGACVADPCNGVECGPCALCSGGACLSTDDGMACDDGDACTNADRCRGGRCHGSATCSADAGVADAGSAPDGDASGDARRPSSRARVGDEESAAGCSCRLTQGGRSRSARPFALAIALALVGGWCRWRAGATRRRR